MKTLKERIKELAEELVAKDLQVYYSDKSDTYLFVTNGKVVCCVYGDYLYGIAVSMEIIPSRTNGSAARIFDPEDCPTAAMIATAIEDLSDTTLAKLRKYNSLVTPIEGRLFYKDAEEWKSRYWTKLIEFK